jgi:thiamine biosynthesis lipoprotein
MRPAEDTPSALSFEAIGTAWRIESADVIDAEARRAIEDRIESFDKTWSRFRDDSLISRISREPGTWELPEESTALFAFYRELYERSRGRVTPLVGRTLETLGYDRAYSLTPEPGQRPAIPAWEDAFSFSGRTLSAPAPVLIDIGAAGKGLLVDIVAELLIDAGHDRAVVDASGDLRRIDNTGSIERVALENPANPALAIGVAHLGAGALAASGTNRRRWGESLHHVLDGVTGVPVTSRIASFVLAESAMVADGLATALLVDEPGQFDGIAEFSWLVMAENGGLEYSPGFPGEVFA